MPVLRETFLAALCVSNSLESAGTQVAPEGVVPSPGGQLVPFMVKKQSAGRGETQQNGRGIRAGPCLSLPGSVPCAREQALPQFIHPPGQCCSKSGPETAALASTGAPVGKVSSRAPVNSKLWGRAQQSVTFQALQPVCLQRCLGSLCSWLGLLLELRPGGLTPWFAD